MKEILLLNLCEQLQQTKKMCYFFSLPNINVPIYEKVVKGMHKKKHLQKRKTLKPRGDFSHSPSAKKIFLSSFFGAILGLVFMLALILLFSAVALSFDYPHGFLTPLSLFVLGGGAFFGGLFATRKNGGAALLCGALSGVFMLLLLKVILTVLPLARSDVQLQFTQKLISLGAIPLSLLGAFSGLPQSKNKSKHK